MHIKIFKLIPSKIIYKFYLRRVNVEQIHKNINFIFHQFAVKNVYYKQDYI